MRVADIEIRAASDQRFPDVLTPEAIDFLARLHREVEGHRIGLLEARARKTAELREGGTFGFLSDTTDLRQTDWRVADAPDHLRVRKVEAARPAHLTMVITALTPE